ncbi:MAG: hypothetical protein ACREL3_00475 [Gemmatimonadales bacterium]
MTASPAPRVLRFGGSSVDTPLRMREEAERVRRHLSAGAPLVGVVGASVYATNRLFHWLRRLAELGDPMMTRELDRALAGAEQGTAALLTATLRGAGIEAVSVIADDAALQGDGPFGHGVLRGIDSTLIRGALDRGVVPVVAGGCARRSDGEIVSLGRLGADITAATLAGMLGGDCHFIVERERLSLSRPGEPLVHLDALRRASEAGVPVRIYSFRSPSP